MLPKHARKDFIPLYNSNCFMNRSLLEHGSKEWHQSRHGVLCASEMGAFLGLDPHKSRKMVLASKDTTAAPEILSPMSERMCDVGKAYEPVAIYQTQLLFNTPLMDPGSLRFASLTHHSLEGHPDAVSVDDDLNCWVPFEIKTRAFPNPYDSVPYESKFDVPFKHWIQLQCYMLMLNSPHGYLVSFSPMHGMRVFEQLFSRDLMDGFILPAVIKFQEGKISQRVNSREKSALVFLIDNIIKNFTHEEAFVPEIEI